VLLPAADQEAAAEPRAPARVSMPHPGGRRVLVIDDNTDATDTMVAMLDLLGHKAQGAYSGEEGLDAAEAFQPDLVLLDLNMPGIDGFAVVRRLRARFGDGLVIAALTGYGRHGDRRATLETGFDAHLTKPVGVEQLQAVLKQVPVLGDG
jgi:CheY-like chemotaxis protein